MGNPYVIKIPPGATEIDIRPALEPIVYQLLRALGPGRADSTYVSQNDVSYFFEKASDVVVMSRLVELINKDDLAGALTDDGFVSHDGGFIWRKSNTCETLYTSYNHSGEDYARSDKWRAIGQLAGHSDLKSQISKAREILSKRLPLDSIVWAVEDETGRMA